MVKAYFYLEMEGKICNYVCKHYVLDKVKGKIKHGDVINLMSMTNSYRHLQHVCAFVCVVVHYYEIQKP